MFIGGIDETKNTASLFFFELSRHWSSAWRRWIGFPRVFLYPQKKSRPTAGFLGALSRSDTLAGTRSFPLGKTASSQEHKVNVRNLVFIGAPAISASYRALEGVPFFVPWFDKGFGFAEDFSGARRLTRAIFSKKRSSDGRSFRGASDHDQEGRFCRSLFFFAKIFV